MENLQSELIGSLSWASSGAPAQRTEWAERSVEEFLSLPLFSEFVFRNVQTIERQRPEQVADFLISHRGFGIIVEQKCQEDPTTRTAQKVDLWARKKAREGWNQVRRAFTRRRDFQVWCDHPRRGRHVFRGGLPPIRHGVVAVEVFQLVDLQPGAKDLPLDHDGVPISYLSLSDFLNLAVQLRSIPELTDYLSARRSLPQSDLRQIGDEESLFSFYLLNDGSFAGCAGRSDARLAVGAQRDRLRAALQRKFESDQYAHLLEHVADELSSRNPKYAEGVPPALLAAYDPATRRQNYLGMQAALADLRLRERAELGRALRGAIARVAEKDHAFTFRAARFDSMPEWVYVLGASKDLDRADLLSRCMLLMGGAMAFYEKPKCLVVVDRDNSGYEVALSRPGVEPTAADLEAGQLLFGGLRITSIPLNFLPDR
jgi:hypothetical protein